MQATTISAKPRTDSGKGPMRRLRAAGQIPAVAYGKNLEPTTLSVSPKDLLNVLGSPFGRNTVLNIDVEGGTKIHALLTDFQYHPLSRELLHADFLAVRDDEMVDVKVPFLLTGKAAGVTAGGVLSQVFRRLPIRCLPSAIPEKIEADVSALGIDDMLHAEDLSLPDGVEVSLKPKRTVAAVIGGRLQEEEEEEAKPEAEAATAEGGEKPAEGGDTPAS
jgi:large subunit ribosomal protein L25